MTGQTSVNRDRDGMAPGQVAAALDRFAYRYPAPLVDDVIELDPGRRVVGIKNVTVGEGFFQLL